MSRLPIMLAVIVTVVLAFGLLYTLKKNLTVAPWAARARDGRVHAHTKNITRLGGMPEDVQRAVERAVFLDQLPPLPAEGSPGWQQVIRAHVQIQGRPRHVVALPGAGEAALAWALPGAYWAAYSGSPVIFVGRDAPGTEAVTALQQLRQHMTRRPRPLHSPKRYTPPRVKRTPLARLSLHVSAWRKPTRRCTG